VPESKSRKEADEKKTSKRAHSQGGSQLSGTATKSAHHKSAAAKKLATRDWVPWVFVPCALIGVAWLVVYYIAGQMIPFMNAIGAWNFGIGIGLIAVAFVLLTFWK
jgi:hypothetical protein